MSKYITLPEHTADAVVVLNEVGGVITASKWKRAAIVACFVRLEGDVTGENYVLFDSPNAFAERGIVGLSKVETVRKYVRAWLDVAGGYPVWGERVKLPTVEFPAMRTGTDGFNSVAGTVRTIERIAADPALAAAAAAALTKAAPETVADAVESNSRASLAASRTRLERASSASSRRHAREQRDARQRRMEATRNGALDTLEQSGMVDHQATIEAQTARSWLRRAVAAYERNPMMTAGQRVDTDGILAEIEHLIVLLRGDIAGWSWEDRDFLTSLGIDEEVAQ